MIRYRVIVPSELRDLLVHLSPTIKQKLHASLRLLETDPLAGKSLERELSGYRSYPIRPYRMVYRIEASGRIIRLVIVAPRHEVYDILLQQLRERG